MNSDDVLGMVGVILILALGFSIGMALGLKGNESRYQKQAIEHGCAEYNQTTGKFQWRDK